MTLSGHCRGPQVEFLPVWLFLTAWQRGYKWTHRKGWIGWGLGFGGASAGIFAGYFTGASLGDTMQGLGITVSLAGITTALLGVLAEQARRQTTND